jgi:hypothetical protein
VVGYTLLPLAPGIEPLEKKWIGGSRSPTRRRKIFCQFREKKDDFFVVQAVASHRVNRVMLCIQFISSFSTVRLCVSLCFSGRYVDTLIDFYRQIRCILIQTAVCGSGPFQTASSCFADKIRSISAPALHRKECQLLFDQLVSLTSR